MLVLLASLLARREVLEHLDLVDGRVADGAAEAAAVVYLRALGAQVMVRLHGCVFRTRTEEEAQPLSDVLERRGRGARCDLGPTVSRHAQRGLRRGTQVVECRPARLHVLLRIGVDGDAPFLGCADGRLRRQLEDGRPLHRIEQVMIEGRKEAKPVFSGQPALADTKAESRVILGRYVGREPIEWHDRDMDLPLGRQVELEHDVPAVVARLAFDEPGGSRSPGDDFVEGSHSSVDGCLVESLVGLHPSLNLAVHEVDVLVVVQDLVGLVDLVYGPRLGRHAARIEAVDDGFRTLPRDEKRLWQQPDLLSAAFCKGPERRGLPEGSAWRSPPFLGGGSLSRGLARPWDPRPLRSRHAADVAAAVRVALVVLFIPDLHAKPPLDEFVGDGQPGDAGAEDCHAVGSFDLGGVLRFIGHCGDSPEGSPRPLALARARSHAAPCTSAEAVAP